MTEVAAEAASGEPMSFDAAVASLVPVEAAPPEEKAAKPAVEPEQPEELQADPEAEGTGEAETPSDGEDPAETPEPVLPAVEAPPHWDDDGKAAFAALPREAQETIRAQADKQGAAASRAINEAAQARQAAESQASKVAQLADGLNTFLPKALETFKGRWEGLDWVQLAQQLNPQEYQTAKAQYEAESRQLEQLHAASQHAEQLAYAQHVQKVEADLPAVAPDLADPKEGNVRVQKVLTFLHTQGYQPDRLKHVSAHDLAIAYDAMRWRNAQANGAAALKPTPKPAAPAMRPTATPAGNSQQRTAAGAKGRFVQNPSVDNAVALLLAKG